MQFSDAAGSQGIVEDIDWLVDSDSTSYPIAHKTRNINAWLDRVSALILQADAKWEWDDTNQSDLPIGTTALTAGQQDYGIDSTYLKIRKVAIKDTNGDLFYLDPMDEADLRGYPELLDSGRATGKPTKYALVGNSIVLDVAPDYTQAAGLKVYFQRNVSYFTVSDTTKTPGFAPMFHRILSYGPALDYAVKQDYQETKKNDLKQKIAQLEAGILNFYANRDQDLKPHLSLQKEDYSSGSPQ